MDEADILSDRALRYGRNVKFLCFIALVVVAADVKLKEAKLFGMSTDPWNVWLVIVIILLYNLISFLYLVVIEWNKWVLDFPLQRATPHRESPDRFQLQNHNVDFNHWYCPLVITFPRFFKWVSFLKIDQLNELPCYHRYVRVWSVQKAHKVEFGLPKRDFNERAVALKRFLVLEFGVPVILVLMTILSVGAKMVAVPVE